MEDLPKIPGPPPPRRLAGPGGTPLRSAQGLGLGPAVVAAVLPGACGRAGSPQAEAAGGGCSASPPGIRLRGLPGAGLGPAAFNSLEPGLRQRPRPPGFVPQAQFIFAKNCNRVWAEALNDFTQLHGGQGSKKLSKEAKGEKDEKDQEPTSELELEAGKEPELKQEVEQASPYSMDDTDPRKFFMSGFTGYVPRARFLFGSSFPVLTNQALQEFGQKNSLGRAQKDSKTLHSLPRTYLRNLGLLPHYGGYVPGYKFQFGHTFGHLTHDALGLSTTQKQLLA
ncbi:Protein FAM166B [Sciurus carolinensis]|uniref:Ciliary microtubule inner protein 2B n=1 Tax=Sciurus carolinensis TaxID=30640 RepID=A0AA41SWX3_SCICA|nr:Protein FAM166B [Sciurus carolinensis]